MFKTILPFLLLVSTLEAQEVPKAEVFGGYEYANAAQFLGGQRTGLNGWDGSVGVNLNRWFGVVTDFSGVYGSSNGSITILVCDPTCVPVTATTNESAKLHSFLFGPQFSLRRSRWVMFGHMLMGGQRSSVSDTINYPPGIGFTLGVGIAVRPSSTGFDLALGGGMDYKIARNLAWRVQSDYLSFGSQNNVRVASGIVFRFGQ